jgi:H+-transporting ATPase
MTILATNEKTGVDVPAKFSAAGVPPGLTSAEADRRRQTFGPNTIADVSGHALGRALEKFWSPVPWMLEGAIALELAMGKFFEATVIGVLLVFNAGLSFFQEGRAQATLAALKSRLAISASVRRDGIWKLVPAPELVPGDMVKLSLGGLVPADAKIRFGEVLLDQSLLTGESAPVEAGDHDAAYAGALIRRGEAVAEVTATGVRTKFGRTAELVGVAHFVSSQQRTVFRVVRNIATFNGALVLGMTGYAYFLHMPIAEIVPLILTAVLASIPVALPATFTLAAALGARNLAKLGVLPTRLSAVDEAGTMDVLCADKTGTLTRNELTVGQVQPMGSFTEADVLSTAAFASAEGGQDPVDLAIRAAASAKGGPAKFKLVSFAPFDPTRRMSEATVTGSSGESLRIVKGAFATVIALTEPSPTARAAAKELESQGTRVMAVALGAGESLKLIGLIALTDPLRDDSASLVQELHALGVKVVMVSGDAPVTALAVARSVGLHGALCPPGGLSSSVRLEDYSVFAGVLPEEKFNLVKSYQTSGHIVGMCGDGANDAPALRQAQIGIAVSTATDVAKSAAGMVLTTPGLAGIVSAVKEGRIIFQRILTYTLNSTTKKLFQVLFILAGLLMTGHAILTPLLMALIMIVGDVLGMSLTTDNVQPSAHPNSWRIGRLTVAGFVMGLGELAFCIAVLAVGDFVAGYSIETLRTLAFVTIVCGNQATTYNNRERRRMWSSRPSWWLVASSVVDTSIACILAAAGIAMAPLPVWVIAGALGGAVVFAVLMDLVKVPLFRHLSLT